MIDVTGHTYAEGDQCRVGKKPHRVVRNRLNGLVDVAGPNGLRTVRVDQLEPATPGDIVEAYTQPPTNKKAGRR